MSHSISSSTSNRPTILIVDDSPTVREVLARALTALGYLVKTCDNPVAVPYHLWKEKPDLVLLDVEMPGMTGDRVAEIALSGRDDPGLKIVFHSSLEDETLQELVQRTGVMGYISKRSCTETITEAVRSFLPLPV